MAAKCTPCMGKELKAALKFNVDDPKLHAALDKVPDCDKPRAFELCGKLKGSKRPLSAYQSFVSECMKAKKLHGFDPEAMKDCAGRWREQKEK